MRRGLISGLVVALLAAAPVAQARPFKAEPRSRALYGMPAAPEVQRVRVPGGEIHTETYRPQPSGRDRPPPRLPVILIMTPYETALTPAARGARANSALRLDVDHFVPRGYAVTVAHVYGTGKSDGCFDLYGPREVDATARVIEHLGEAPWSNGRIGMYGLSYPGETQIAVAALGDRTRTRALKAIVPVAGATGFYDSYAGVDGVPFVAGDTQNHAGYHLLTNPPAGEAPRAERVPCVATQLATSGTRTGDFTGYDAEREFRRGAGDIRAAVLLGRGLLDTVVHPIADAGFLDQLDPDTPLSAIVGQWGHVFPDEGGRDDWLDMVVAWYDRWLKRLPTGVRDWPRVQVEASDGTWRQEDSWPARGERRQLALGADGRLGSAVAGETTFAELSHVRGPGAAVFETVPLTEAVHLTGTPEVDLWLETDRPDAHVGVRLDVLDAAGDPVTSAQMTGMRSLQHLDPFVDGRFDQRHPRPAAVGTPLHVPVRINPVDVVAPAGGRIRLSVAGVTDWDVSGIPQAGAPSGGAATLTLLHGRGLSALQVITPNPASRPRALSPSSACRRRSAARRPPSRC